MNFIDEFHNSGTKVICNFILEMFAKNLPKRFNFGTRRVCGAGMIFVLFAIIQLLILLVIKHAIIPILIIPLIFAFISSLAVYVVSCCYSYTLRKLQDATNVLKPSEVVDDRIVNWLKKVTNIWAQILTSVLATIIILFIFYLINKKFGPLFDYIFPIYIGLVLLIFWMAQGLYWAIMTPFLARELRLCDINEVKVDPFFPTQTPILVTISNLLTVYAIWDAVMVSLCLIALFVINPDFSTGAKYYLLIMVFFGYLATSWTFLFPQFNLYIIVQKSKKLVLWKIQLESNKFYNKLGNLTQTDFERLKSLMELNSRIRKGRNTFINFAGIQSFLASLFTPTVVAIIGVLNWENIIKKIEEIF